MVRDNGEERACLPVVEISRPLLRPISVSMPFASYGGILGEEAEARRTLIRGAGLAIREGRCAYIEVRQRGGPVTGLYNAPETHARFVLDLQSPMPEIWSRIRKTLRHDILRGERATEVRFGHDLLESFYHVFNGRMHLLGTPCHPLGWFRELVGMFPSSAEIAVAFVDGTPVAGGLFLATDSAVHYAWGATTPVRTESARFANLVLVWTAIRRYIERRYRYFDFGRSAIGSAGERFKSGWGVERLPLSFAYIANRFERWPDRNPKGARRRALAALWSSVPPPISRRVGPLLRAYLP